MLSFAESLNAGKVGESLISKWFQSRGYAVLPVYEVAEGQYKGPRLYMGESLFIAPDMLVMNHEKVIWVEAKNKSHFTWHRKSQKWTTGIDVYCFQHYREIKARLNLPVWLMFLHLSSRPSGNDLAYGSPKACPIGLFGGDVDYLAANINHQSDRWGKKGMIYWSSDVLKLCDTASAFQVEEDVPF